MRQQSKKIIWILCILLGLGMICFTYYNHAYYKKSIVQITHVEDKKGNTKQQQMITGKVLNGKYKGQKIEIENEYTKSLVYDEKYEVHDQVFVSIQGYNNRKLQGNIIGVKRDYLIITILVTFVFIVCAVGGRKGVMSIISLILNLFIFYAALSFYEKGISILPLTIFMVLSFSVLSLFIVSGKNKRTLSALASTLVTLLLVGILSAIVLFYYRDLDYEFLENITKPYRYYDAVLLFFAEVLIGGLGAIMDIAITMSETVHELSNQKGDIGWKKLFSSCREVGYDIMGTMISVMFFTNLSGCIPFFALAMKNEVQLRTLTKYYIPFEAVRFLTSGIGIVIAIPIAAYVSIGIYTRRWRP